MYLKSMAIAFIALFAIMISVHGAEEKTAKEKALEAGAEQLNADEIADRIVGHTVTAVSGDKKVLVYYGEDNGIAGRLVDGDWSDTGFYGITNEDRICLSWNESDKGRLRCMTVLVENGTVKKYDAEGNLSAELVEIQEGNQL